MGNGTSQRRIPSLIEIFTAEAAKDEVARHQMDEGLVIYCHEPKLAFLSWYPRSRSADIIEAVLRGCCLPSWDGV